MEDDAYRAMLSLILGGKVHLIFCLAYLFLCARNKPLFFLALLLACQSTFDFFSHFILRTFLESYRYDFWFGVFIFSQSMVIIGIYLKQIKFNIKLKIDHIIIITGFLMLCLQFIGLIALNGFNYINKPLISIQIYGVQLLAFTQLFYLAIAIIESRRNLKLLKAK